MAATRSLDLLARKTAPEVPPLVVVFGDEDFLKRRVLGRLRHWLVGDDPDDFTYGEHAGDTAELAAVLDAVHTPAFVGDCRMVVVDAADAFVTRHRDALERYAAAGSSTGVLVLDVKAFPGNTRLAKQVDRTGMAIDCQSFEKRKQGFRVADWAVEWAAAEHGKTLRKDAAELLVELIGSGMGQLDGELAKLADYAGERKTVDREMVVTLVAGTRVESAFRLLDLVLEGDAGQALAYLDQQLTMGQAPIALLAALSASLRKLTHAARLVTEENQPMRSALSAAGVPPFAHGKSAAQMKHLGRPRMAAMYRTLLKANYDLVGGSGLSPRLVMERLLLHLARPQER